MPEVSLVAILDADKEGYLRSEGSLIQTIGRAARNVRGKAILYADRITNSMQAALDETERRRSKQLEHNETHGIEPATIYKRVADIMEGAYATKKVSRAGGRQAAVADSADDLSLLTPDQAARRIAEKEKQMFEHAKNLEFEDAARIRDEIETIKTSLLVA